MRPGSEAALARIQGLQVKEIAKRMNRSPDAISQLIRRALMRLRETLGDTESLGLPAKLFDFQGEEDDAGE